MIKLYVILIFILIIVISYYKINESAFFYWDYCYLIYFYLYNMLLFFFIDTLYYSEDFLFFYLFFKNFWIIIYLFLYFIFLLIMVSFTTTLCSRYSVSFWSNLYSSSNIKILKKFYYEKIKNKDVELLIDYWLKIQYLYIKFNYFFWINFYFFIYIFLFYMVFIKFIFLLFYSFEHNSLIYYLIKFEFFFFQNFFFIYIIYFYFVFFKSLAFYNLNIYQYFLICNYTYETCFIDSRFILTRLYWDLRRVDFLYSKIDFNDLIHCIDRLETIMNNKKKYKKYIINYKDYYYLHSIPIDWLNVENPVFGSCTKLIFNNFFYFIYYYFYIFFRKVEFIISDFISEGFLSNKGVITNNYFLDCDVNFENNLKNSF